MARRGAQGGASILDVARRANVSTSTVSRVLNGQASSVAISEATAERVRRAAADLRYQPNSFARGLRTSRTNTIGVIVHDLLHPFTAELLRAIYAACDTRGYHLLVGNAEHRDAEGKALGSLLAPERVDGLLLVGDTLYRAGPDADLATFVGTHSPIVSVAGRPSVAGELSLYVDNEAGVTLALEYLVGLGHRAIAYIADDDAPDSWENRQRRETYRRFLHSHTLPWHPEWDCAISADLDAARAALRTLLAGPRPPSAAFVNNDMTAIVALKAALTSGIRVPGDLSLAGFDDIAFAALCTPGLTTVRQPMDDMGRRAIDALFDAIDHAGDTPVSPSSANIIFPPSLVRRASCAPP